MSQGGILSGNTISATHIDFISGNTGTSGPDGSGNFSIVGSGSLSVAVNPATHQATISTSLVPIETITGNAGVSGPNGSGNFTLTGLGNLTVSVNPGTFSGTVAEVAPSIVQLSGNSGTATADPSNNINLIGSGTSKFTNSSHTSTLTVTSVFNFIVDPAGNGDFSTIGAAVAASSAASATSQFTIGIKPGVYTENFTMGSYIHLIAMDEQCSEKGGGSVPASNLYSVRILGTVTLSGGNNHICNIWSQQTAGNNTYSTSTGAGPFFLKNCKSFVIDAAHISLGPSGSFFLDNCNFEKGSGSTTSNFFTTNNTAIFNINNCFIDADQIVSNGTANISMYDTIANFAMSNTGSGNGQTVVVEFSDWQTALSAPVLNSDGVLNLTARFSRISTTATNAVSNASASSSYTIESCRLNGLLNISANSTQKLVRNSYGTNTTSPGAYPYTTLPTDVLVLVSTTSARAITLYGKMTAGEAIILKDITGTAATNNITITPPGGSLIDGSATYVMNTNYQSVTLVFDGTNFQIV